MNRGPIPIITSQTGLDIVIPIGIGSKHGNKELEYCLKAIQRHLTGYRNIVIVGEYPGIDVRFFQAPIVHIQCKDHGFNIQDNIRRKIEIACNWQPLSDNFFFMNDDHIFLQDFHVSDMPYYYDGDIELAYRRKRKNGSYKSALQNTINALEKAMYAPYHFDIHVPITYNKKLFPQIMAQYPWATCKWGYVIKSLYCNTLMIQGEKMSDCVVAFRCEKKEQIEAFVKDRFVFSFNDDGANDVMFEFLKERFDGPTGN